ncbi:MAG: anion permease [Bdellovibrionales bacterium]
MIDMDTALLATGLVVLAAIAFDFVNGFHDASNSIATIVATRVLKPKQAVIWAAAFNFIALFLFGTGVAKTVGSGMIALDTVTPLVIFAGLIGAIGWGLTTWWFGLPTSSSHALLGGYAGAAMTNNILVRGWDAAFSSIIAAGWIKTIIFIVLAPIIGLLLAQGLMKFMLYISKARFKHNNLWFGRLQLFSSAFLSLMHGSNDAQKTAGIITGVLVAGGHMDDFVVHDWVLWVSYGTMALGTLAGGWRIVHTMGRRITRLNTASGFCAESAAALSILLATSLHLPVSTTHTTTGAIIGVGAARRFSAVRWSLAGRIAWAWVFTIPGAAGIGGVFMTLAYFILRLGHGG